MLRRVAVLGSESEIAGPDEQAAGQRAGRTLADSGITVLTSGFGYGPVGTAIDAALAASGQVIGVVLDRMPEDAIHPGLTERRLVPDRPAQLRELASLADAFLLLPGAVDTLEEVLQLREACGSREVPFGLLDDGGGYSTLLADATDAVLDRFIRDSQRGAVALSRDLAELLQRLRSYRAPESRRADPEG